MDCESADGCARKRHGTAAGTPGRRAGAGAATTAAAPGLGDGGPSGYLAKRGRRALKGSSQGERAELTNRDRCCTVLPTTMPGPKLLTVESINSALSCLSEQPAEGGDYGELVIVGGAAIALTLGGREATRDVDGYISKPEARKMRTAAAQVAARLGLPTDWLNDGAKGYMLKIELGPIVFQSPSLMVYAASSLQLLAMKLWAWRDDQDIEDAGRLLAAVLAERPGRHNWNCGQSSSSSCRLQRGSNQAMLWKTCGNRSADPINPQRPLPRSAPVGC